MNEDTPAIRAAHDMLDRAGIALAKRPLLERLDYVFTDGALGVLFNRLSSGEQMLVRVAQLFHNGGGNVTVYDLVSRLDRENLTRVLELIAQVYVDR